MVEASGLSSLHPETDSVLRWSDRCTPLACRAGPPFRAVAQASIEDFCLLGVALLEDRLQLDDGLLPSRIVPVLLQQSAISTLLDQRRPQAPRTVLSLLGEDLRPPQPLQTRKGSLLLPPDGLQRLEERRSSEPLRCTQDPDPDLDLDPEDRSSGTHHHMEGHGHHLHLSSCHECLELENSTILSVKYASAENISDFPDERSDGMDSGAEGVEELEHDAETGGLDSHSKPPNVLVFSGDSQERFQAVQQLLSECLNVEQNIIYHLQPQQALGDPWLENTRLLVLAEPDALSPQLQTRFLTYLSLGGKVLGLSSSLCPAGLCLELRAGRRMQVSRLSFTREDSSEVELSALASGRVYIRDAQGGGEVELWGELRGNAPHERDMVIVRVTHGEDGGEAVLCQVHFEIAADSQNVCPADFDVLKLSSALRYEVLTEILTSLGLSCEPGPAPAPSPVRLLATSEVCLMSNGVSSAAVSDPTPGTLPLLTDSPSPAQFNMETYRRNLKTKALGHVLLYAEAVTSTMDLLEGLSLHLPKDESLTAVADRQIQGRGRGRNAWLSPLGCAMFTVSVQVELSSRLGQRIPFVQHLSALAVVEAVRTLPGYQDIDLRVKWPNDIYYSNLVKIGGVLVTSTVTGSTFHLLIGCGFNVTNSNPTVCINDLIQQHNKQHSCSLQPLTCPQLIARTLTCLESFIHSLQQDGPDAVLPVYYKRWLHSGTQVRLWSEDGLEAQVVGLDQNGFLQVHSREQGLVSVEPDGNSFDMLKNLVVMKQR
uniref:Holocarboxylase synthetase (biotin-(proprionyl-CoA-carboxylase (ATP-hydrolysing)) ligase) n=1 Tax=Salarias fasciatus TaxID=181472 RepID=A0A672FE12_SALFA